jgi:hypothetical protein
VLSKSNLAAGAGILVAGVAIFFGSRALTDSLDSGPSTPEHPRPRIVGIAATPIPPPPAWPPRKESHAPSEEPTGSDSGGPEVEEPTESGTTVEPPTPPPSNPPPEHPDESSGHKSGSGWEEEERVGG